MSMFSVHAARAAPLLGRIAIVFALAGAWVSVGSGWRALESQNRAPVAGYQVVNVYPHDPSAYTQGLIFRDGFLFESTGLNGRSTVRKVRLQTGVIVRQAHLGSAHFGEGLTEFNGEL